MEICAACGLPKIVCVALVTYRNASSALECGRLDEARQSADDAATYVKEYRARRIPVQPIELTDDERLRLSALLTQCLLVSEIFFFEQPAFSAHPIRGQHRLLPFSPGVGL